MSVVLRSLLRGLIASLIAIAVSGSIGLPAMAYVTNGYKWCDRWADITTMTLDPQRPYTLQASPVADAAASWTNVGVAQMGGKVDFDFIFRGGAGTARVELFSLDRGVNGTLATATRWGYPVTGCITYVDIEYNRGYGWNPPTTTCSWPAWFSIYSVGLHELGHALSLDHVDPSVNIAIMNPTITQCTNPGLTGDDEAGIIAIYGRRG